MMHHTAANTPGRGTGILVLLLTTVFGLALAPAASRAAEQAACKASAAARQLDYWVGDWVVTNPSGGADNRSSSKVRLALDQCVVIESWSDHKGHDGENIFGYSEGDGGWRGMFFDNHGRVHVFVDGKVNAGAAEFSGPSRGAHGEAVLNRIRLVRVAPDRLEQTWEKSTDDGRTWTQQFRLDYARRAP
jgi:hypothetical protein